MILFLAALPSIVALILGLFGYTRQAWVGGRKY